MLDRPSGTVTFLFTDIEGSTRLWEQSPESMKLALARHDDVVRSAITAASGTIFATGGDGVAAAFGRASDAVNAAVAAQRALDTVEWPSGAALRVRMGLHTGEADERDGDYFGPPVNRAARVMSAGHGGQIILTDTTASVLGQVSGVQLIDLGSHRLKGLLEPVQLFGVDADDVAWLDRPLVSDQAVDGNLPRPASEFVGRIDDLRQRASELDLHRLVTLTGPGGVGKTRLAIEVGWQAAERFPGGVWLIDLSNLGDSDAVAVAVLATVDAQLLPGMTVTATIVEWLRARRTLLVIDNCDHVLDGAAALVGAVLAGSPTTSMLVTSREPLGVAGESVRVVSPLPIGREAVELFVQRAAAATGDFNLTTSTRQTIEALCARLDGIPLAIELAAARVRSLSPSEILARLDDRFRLLRSTGRGSQERHQTLQATVNWSYQLLDEDAKLLFARLSVFAGSFDLSAAEVVCGTDPLDAFDLLDLLASLVDKSMVLAEAADSGGTRYRLLETLREFGETRLVEGPNAERLRDRHGRHYLDLAEQTFVLQATASEAVAVKRFDTEWTNLRAAFDWSLASGREHDSLAILAATGYFAYHTLRWEHADWTRRATSSALERGSTPVGLQTAAMTWSALSGDFGLLSELGASLPADVSTLTDIDQVNVWSNRALLGSFTGDHEIVRSAYAWLRRQDVWPADPFTRGWMLHHLIYASGALLPGEVDELVAESARLASLHGAPTLHALSHLISGIVTTLAGADPQAAVEALRRCVNAAESVHSTFVVTNCEAWLGGIATNGPPSNARDFRRILQRAATARMSLLVRSAFPLLSVWFARIGELATAAIFLGVSRAHPPADLLGLLSARTAEATQLLAGFAQRDELVRQGEALTLDESMDRAFHELARIEDAGPHRRATQR